MVPEDLPPSLRALRKLWAFECSEVITVLGLNVLDRSASCSCGLFGLSGEILLSILQKLSYATASN